MSIKDDVYKKFNSKTTEELLQIYDENDRNKFSEDTYKIIEEILEKRNVFEKIEENPVYDYEESEFGFWSFKKLIILTLIQILYPLGMLAITITGILMIIRGTQISYGETIIILYGIVICILGNLLWRISCESTILIYKIFEKLNQIEQKI